MAAWSDWGMALAAPPIGPVEPVDAPAGVVI
jgi:hypothetical protein